MVLAARFLTVLLNTPFFRVFSSTGNSRPMESRGVAQEIFIRTLPARRKSASMAVNWPLKVIEPMLSLLADTVHFTAMS
ncbi:MAG TPA: hypothetical protein DCM87_03480 [Planctomycetes bacterium]|nr:hypothetical protein [Planctomycetota bacterium]